MLNTPYQHAPVMVQEVLEYLKPSAGKVLVDCTLGGGGHAEAILSSPLHPSPLHGEGKYLTRGGGSLLHKVEKGIKGMRIVGFDQDLEAIKAAKERLSNYHNVTYIHDNFIHLKKHLKKKVDGILFDLGISSYQIDEASRGFSFQKDGPLDMRMDQAQKLTAAEIVNKYSAEDLEQIFKGYGEERFAGRIARKIVESRKTSTSSVESSKVVSGTQELREIIERAIPTWRKRESVARVFQALRIAVNSELENLLGTLKDSIGLLKSSGRIVIISYHSLEDRIVKQTFRTFAKDGILKVLTKKPVTPSEKEIKTNPRAKSAKLRAAEKL